MRTPGKLGKQSPDPTRPSLRLSAILKAQAPVPPSSDYISEVEAWPMYMNDSLGICAIAAPGHAIEGWTRYGQGATVVVPDSAVLTGYKDVGHYVEGDPSTDNGCVLQDVLDYWRKTGIGGHKILFFAKVDLKNRAEVEAAIHFFGHVIYGFQVPEAAISQFKEGQPWEIVANEGANLGGHAINVGSYKQGANYNAITWGTVQAVSPAFLDKYGDEAWVIGTQDWLSAVDNKTPTGLDLGGLGAEFAALTGEPNPFPDPTPPAPAPEPIPVPPEPPAPPVPGPAGPDAADEAVAPTILHLTEHHWVSKHSQLALLQWLDAKGL